MSQMLNLLGRFVPYFQLALGLAILGVVVYLVSLVVKARKNAAAIEEEQEPRPVDLGEEEQDGPSASAGVSALKRAFARGIADLKSLESSRDARYQIPWVAMIGQSGSRFPEMLGNAGLALPLGPANQSGACRWWFLDRGLVIDLDGEYVLSRDGRGADRRGWRTFLRLLQKHRPERPLDSIVLSISARDLLVDATPQRLAELEEKAVALYERIAEAQKVLGLRLPVYVLVTDCHAVPGFGGFWEGLSDQELAGIFGWSNPHGLDQSYRPEWLDQAFEKVGKRLNTVRTRQLARSWSLAEPDGLVAFRHHFEKLQPTLQAYLNQIFRPSAYHDSLLCRGVFFTGAPGAAALQSLSSFGSSEGTDGASELAVRRQSPNFFLKDLWEQKIFREAGLATATASSVFQSNRRVRWAQVALVLSVVLFSFGLYWAHGRLDARRASLQPFLEDTVAEWNRFSEPVTIAGDVDQMATVNRVLTELASVDGRPFRSIWIPSSWFSPFRRDLEDFFHRAWDQVFHALHDELTERSGELFAGGSPPRFESLDAVERLPEFAALQRYVSGVVRLERVADSYNCLVRPEGVARSECRSRPSDLRALDDIMEYLEGARVPDQIFDSSDLYQRALEKVTAEPFDLSRYRAAADQKVRLLFQDFYDRLFEASELKDEVEDLGREIRDIGSAPSAELEFERLETILTLIRSLQNELASPRYSWAFSERFDLGPSFRQLAQEVDASDLLRDSSTMISVGNAAWRQHSLSLAQARAPATGELLKRRRGQERSGLPLPELSEGVELVAAAVNELLREDLVADGVEDAPRLDLPEGLRISWDERFLAEALRFYEAFDRLRSVGLENFPRNLRSTVEEIVATALNQRIIGRINDARQVEESGRRSLTEDELTAEIDSYQEAAPTLLRLIGVLDELRSDEEDVLAASVRLQGQNLLRAIEQLKTERGLYLPRGGDFEWWDGVGSPALEAYQVESLEALSVHVAEQREQLLEIAQDFARPLAETLEQIPGSVLGQGDLLSEWDELIEELEAFEANRPGNRVAELESWILESLPQVTLETCFDLTRLVPGGSTNFFVQRGNELRLSLQSRCATLGREGAISGYISLSRLFNQRLAGRRPFSAEPFGSTVPEVDPSRMRDFFRVYDQLSRPVLQGLGVGSAELGTAVFGTSSRPVGAFMNELEDVRNLFSEFLTGGDPAPVFDFDVEFRVNRSQEVFAEQIIDWTLEVGDRKVSFRDEALQAKWRVGDPVIVTLRWATDSPRQPVFVEGRPDVEVRDGAVVFEYDSRWSLISLVREHQASPTELSQLQDLNPHTLGFSVVTECRQVEGPIGRRKKKREEVPAEGCEPGRRETRAYIRVVLVRAEENLVLPRFPVEAPELPSELISITQSASARGVGN